jgi:hypothetical protein
MKRRYEGPLLTPWIQRLHHAYSTCVSIICMAVLVMPLTMVLSVIDPSLTWPFFRRRRPRLAQQTTSRPRTREMDTVLRPDTDVESVQEDKDTHLLVKALRQWESIVNDPKFTELKRDLDNGVERHWYIENGELVVEPLDFPQHTRLSPEIAASYSRLRLWVSRTFPRITRLRG